MPSRQGLAIASRNPPRDALRCPWCQGELLCEPRRVVDRLLSLFHPVKRYRCNSFHCQWIGNLPRRHGDDDSDDASDGRGVGYPAGKRSRLGVPPAFVVHMVLVAVGVVFVIVFSSMEPASWVVENAKAFESTFIPPPDSPIRSVDAR